MTLLPKGMFANSGNPPFTPQGAPQPQFGQPPQLGPMGTTPFAQQPQAPAPAPSFFGQGGVGRGIAGAIGDYLLQSQHMQPIYAPAMQQRQHYAQQNRMAQQNRQDDNADWLAKQQWELAHPKPQGPTSLQKDAEYYKSIGRNDLAESLLVNHATAPPLVVDNGNGTKTVYPQGTVPRGPAPAPSAPQVGTVEGGYRFKGGNPSDQSAWEPVGGTGGPAPASEDQGAAILGNAARTGMLSAADAAVVRSAFGPNGQAAFDNWLVHQKIRIAQ